MTAEARSMPCVDDHLIFFNLNCKLTAEDIRGAVTHRLKLSEADSAAIQVQLCYVPSGKAKPDMTYNAWVLIPDSDQRAKALELNGYVIKARAISVRQAESTDLQACPPVAQPPIAETANPNLSPAAAPSTSKPKSKPKPTPSQPSEEAKHDPATPSVAAVSSSSSASSSASKGKQIVLVNVGAEFIDIGINLGDKRFQKDLDQVLARANSAGVCQQVITGVSIHSSEHGIEIALAHPGVLFTTVGVHPHEAERVLMEQAHGDLNQLGQRLESLIRKHLHVHDAHGIQHRLVVAVGEAGLDYNRNFSKPEIQREVFRCQVALACKLQLPMFLHEREAQTDLFAILDEFKSQSLPPVVVHCFTGTEAELDRLIAAGFHIGITGFVAMQVRGADLRKFVAKIPLDKLMIETDAPYMSADYVPVGCEHFDAMSQLARALKKSGRNEPCAMPVIAQTLADLYGIDVKCFAERVLETTRKFFCLST